MKISLKNLIHEKFLQYNKKIALQYQEDKITYNDLLKNSKQLSISLLNKDYSKIAISIENKIDLMLIVLACIFAEIPFIIIDKNSPKSFLQDILSKVSICPFFRTSFILDNSSLSSLLFES